MQTMRTVYSTDRWFTFPKFEETTLYLRGRLKQSGLENIEIGGASADGATQAGFWTMPLAWDVKQAHLEIIDPERATLCDYASVPTSLGMWSGPTPKGGVTAELVDIATTPWPEVKGKLVLTEKISPGYKFQLAKYGALGAVNGFSENRSLVDGRQWINAWGDNGWGFTKASTPLLSYSVTPRQAAHLRELLASHKKVVLHAVADTRYYAGRYPYVTATLPGTSSDEEVLVLGHTSEQGAQDNATGVAAMTEAVNTLSRLISQGTLPRPPRTIRILLMPELYGSLSYISAHPERMRHTVAAMTVDTPAASYDLADTEYTFYMNPQVAMSYTDMLVQRIARNI
jgi:Peptidase family M28